MSITTASLLPDPPKRAYEEEQFHRSVVQFLRWALPASAVMFHVPNGGLRHKRAAAKMVALGVKAGVPDLEIVYAGRPIFLELKAPRGVLSMSQRQMIKRLTAAGATVLVCRTLEEVAAQVGELVPMQVQLS